MQKSLAQEQTMKASKEPHLESWWSTLFFLLAIVATLLLVYASLVPLRFVPLSPKETYLRWKQIPWNNISLYSRSDWIANALVVIPSAFFLSGAVDAGRRSRWLLILATPLILLFLAAIVLGIELVQVWFPPRTVSQNDIFAGWCGAIIGIVTWFLFGRTLVLSTEKFIHFKYVPRKIRWLAGALCIAGLIYTVYPFDFIVSRDEFLQKFNAGRVHLGIDGSSIFHSESLKGLIVAAIKVFPFGVWLGLARGEKMWWRALIAVAITAIAIELIQIPIYTKHASTAEAIAGSFGGWGGLWMARTQETWTKWMDRSWIWSTAWLAWSIVLILAFNLRFDSILSEGKDLDDRWDAFFVPPLMRYYYNSEYSAFSNLLGKIGMFSILGVFWGLVGWTKTGRCTASRFSFGLVWAIVLGIAIEVMQVYLPPMIADASDIGLYGLGYVLGYVATAMVFGEREEKTKNSTNSTNENQNLESVQHKLASR